MDKFKVQLQRFADLSEAEQLGSSNNGWGQEYANYLRVSRNGGTIFLESDACEPEDATLSRDYRWVKEAIEYAYECGVQDGKEQSANIPEDAPTGERQS